MTTNMCLGQGELILGYDARQIGGGVEKAWNESRKEEFLFRPDVELPLSVDPCVWPSVFESHQDLRPAYIGFYQNFWENLGFLSSCLEAKNDLKNTNYWVIAVSLITTGCSSEELQSWTDLLVGVTTNGNVVHQNVIPHANPSSSDETWQFLGYDVADQWGTSGLTNCGFLAEEDIKKMVDRWTPHLNNNHLFRELRLAQEFKHFSDMRVVEHSPFFVYALYGIKCSTR